MKNVQIPYELFVSMLRYHLMEEDDCLNEIRQGLEQKLDSLVRHELYQAASAAASPRYVFPPLFSKKSSSF